MKFGICTGPESASLMKSQGWDYVEGNTQKLLQGQSDQWDQLAAITSAALPVRATNVMVPGTLSITGPKVDFAALTHYMTHVLTRAGQAGIKTIVFGSGGARKIPDGFDRGKARQQIIDFASMFAPIASDNGVTVVAEPLNQDECNVLTTVGESMEYVKAVNHPGFQCLVDSYHFWKESEPLENLRAAMPWIKHVHVADLEGRVAPGKSGKADYQPFFKTLKAGGYAGPISVECSGLNIAEDGEKLLAFLKKEWARA